MNNQQLIELYKSCRQLSEEICSPLNIEDYSLQVVRYASPLKWHLAHTTWFFEEMILKKKEGFTVYSEEYSYLFNSYYNSIGKRVAQGERGGINRPFISEVYKYREYVDKAMLQLLNTELSSEDVSLIITGINHEQQHQELMFSDIKIGFYSNPTLPVYREEFKLSGGFNNGLNEYIKIDSGLYDIGYNGTGFSYDNERGRHKVFLEEFHISSNLATKGEYLEFINSGGYNNFVYWLDEGWQWVKENNIKAPLYWYKKGNNWVEYSLLGEENIIEDEILCHISFYEADAYARWKGCRLPTEFEWEASSKQIEWGKRWEWTNSAYLPYPRFKISEGALGEYNGKFMINQMVLRGCSTATSPGHERNTYRNFFHADRQWQYTGIRLVK